MAGYDQKTFVNIYQSLLRRLRSTNVSTGTFDLLTGVKYAVNQAIHDVTSDSWYEWTIREFWFNTTPPVASASPLSNGVSILAGSSIMTCSAASFTAGMVGRFALIGGGRTPYEIVGVIPSSTITLAVGFEGTTDQSNVAWRIIQDAFTITTATASDGSSGARVRGIRKMVLEDGQTRWPLVFIPPREWDRAYPRAVNEQRPYYYTVIRWTLDGIPRIKLYPIPSTRFVLRFTAYCWLPELTADADTLEVPGPAHRVIEDQAFVRCLTDILHEEGPHVQFALAEAKEGREKLVREDSTKPDWDPVRGETPWLSKGWPVIVFPPEFGQAWNPMG